MPCSTATVTITITGQNDAPVAANVYGPRASMGRRRGDGVLHRSRRRRHHSFSDRYHRHQGQGDQQRQRDFSYDPEWGICEPDGGATATDTFLYTVTDGSNAASTATVTITITGQNDPPVAAMYRERARAWPGDHGDGVLHRPGSWRHPQLRDRHHRHQGQGDDHGNGASATIPMARLRASRRAQPQPTGSPIR